MPDRKYRGRRRGVQIRTGSVRKAREDAGLTLADVAGSSVSRTAIHLIEHGRTKPSLETLRHIARATGKPIEFFLSEAPEEETQEASAVLRELELLASTRAYEQLISAGSELLGRPWPDAQRARLRFYLGQAHCRLVHPDEALPHLEFARKQFTESGDDWMAAEALDWEAAARALNDDPAALSLAFDALERCRRLTPKPLATEARILSHIAAIYVSRQSWKEALRHYQMAVDVGSGVKDLREQARMHHGIATAYQRMNTPVKAREHFDKAIALYSLESDLSALYRVENDLGCLLLQEGNLDSAENHLRVALRGCQELGMDHRGIGFVLNSLAALDLSRERLSDARAHAVGALEAGEASGEAIVLADAYTVLGQIDEAEGNPGAADECFSRAISALNEADMPDRLRDCHMRYAELLEARPDVLLASRQWRKAAEVGRDAAAGVSLKAASVLGKGLVSSERSTA